MLKKLFLIQILFVIVINGFSQSTSEDEMFKFAETGARQKLTEAGSTYIEDWEHFGDGSQVIHLQQYSEVNIIAITMDADAVFRVITKDNKTLTPNKIGKDGMYYYGFTFTSGVEDSDKPRIEYRINAKPWRTKIFIGTKKAW